MTGFMQNPTPEQMEKAGRLQADIVAAVVGVVKSYGGDKPGVAAIDVAGLGIELARAAGKMIRPITVMDPENAASVVNDAIGALTGAAGFNAIVVNEIGKADGPAKDS